MDTVITGLQVILHNYLGRTKSLKGLTIYAPITFFVKFNDTVNKLEKNTYYQNLSHFIISSCFPVKKKKINFRILLKAQLL